MRLKWFRQPIRLSRSGGLIVRALLVALAIIPSVGFARAYLRDQADQSHPFVDANTYLAAGERLNAGHDLYSLVPGDRPIDLVPGVSTSPLLSTPPIAAVWRPLAALDWGYPVWVLACWIVLLGTIAYLVVRVGLPAVVLTLALSLGVGQQLAVANVTSFFPALLILAWKFRSNPWIGAVIGVMGAFKIAPYVVLGWLIGGRRTRHVVVAAIASLLVFALGAALAGPASYVEYATVAQTAGSSPQSLSRLAGISWLSQSVLALGFVMAIVLGRFDRLAFVVVVLTSTIGTPALYFGSLVSLLALVAPLDHTNEIKASSPVATWNSEPGMTRG